jgi:diaminopimelate epimerase
VRVHLVYGELTIEWAEDGCVYQQGPATDVFSGEWPA